MESREMTVQDVRDIGVIVGAAENRSLIAWEGKGAGSVITGTARGLTDEQGNFDYKHDVRDLFLWVTLTCGGERFVPVRDLLPLVRRGTFAVDWEPK